MTTVYRFEITYLNCYPQYADQTDVVFTVGWNYWGDNGTIQTYIPGSTPLTYTAGGPFTPYDQLTQDQVIGWVTTSLGPQGIANVQSILDARIQYLASPPVVSPPLPWGS